MTIYMMLAGEERTSCSRGHSGDNTADGLRARGDRRRICSCRSRPSEGAYLKRIVNFPILLKFPT